MRAGKRVFFSLSLAFSSFLFLSCAHLARVPSGDLGNAALLMGCRLGEATVMQSFAISDDGRTIYALQLMPGGRARSERGDLCITKLDISGGIKGRMYALGFGHGVQMGVEPGPEGDWLWTEIEAVSDGSNGWGRRLARFRFVDGAVLHGTISQDASLGLQVFSPIPGTDRTTVNVDSRKGRLVMRYRQNGLFRYAVYPLGEASAGIFRPVADLAQPACLGTFQGFVLLGEALYFLDGDSKASPQGSVPGGNVYITRAGLDGSRALDRRRVRAGLDLGFREPEGMSLYPGEAGPELVFGLASYESPGSTAKVANFLRCAPF